MSAANGAGPGPGFGTGGDWAALLGVKGGPAIRPGSSMPSSVLLRLAGRTVLVDAGLGTARAICDQGVPLTGIDLILITHLHSDHYLELGPLLHTAWTAGLTRPVRVVGPPGLSAYWEGFLASMAFDIELRIADEGRVPLAPLAGIEVLEEGPVAAPEGLAITARRNHHPPIEESYALRIEGAGRSVVLSGDTAPHEGWAGFCRGADLLIHEALLEAGVDALVAGLAHPDPRLKAHILRSHTQAGEVGRIAAEAGVGALALTHLVPEGLPGCEPAAWEAEVRRHFAGPLHPGRDGMRIGL
ncbi:MBL fold metallo-hydrolase [Wenxinia saemankumensis]|uniref:Ribonuclease BN, tRNA processing enzyme n=1 Tax=Wenxinia saemankumensis TaxID=1447782 RepID=A0A1M6FP99_9RHOB|nr:MBL fold metallo-hydrolase [Wenxinia saemankumensis]SHI99495.1 Ribonuclease BN, tRNA processing enzyme [Wenxinia saemankumensis]